MKQKKIIRLVILTLLIGVSSARAAEQTAVFAGGCFWGVEAVFEHVKGVSTVVSGYSGGTKETANYETVSNGKTDHAESVMVKFDPEKVTYQQLLFIFFSVAHDPTELNYQGPDHGRQYRSVIFYTNETQKTQALAFIKAVDDSKALKKPVVTEVVPFKAFYAAEDEHQDFVKLNPTYDYVVYNDLPKLKELKKKFPELYRN
jgi:peptide-methionine (S)-S-oxide reductase